MFLCAQKPSCHKSFQAKKNPLDLQKRKSYSQKTRGHREVIPLRIQSGAGAALKTCFPRAGTGYPTGVRVFSDTRSSAPVRRVQSNATLTAPLRRMSGAQGMTALIHAARCGKVDVARLLIGEGKADVEAKDNKVSAPRMVRG